jgi:phage baseplate assembly protein V
MNMVAKMKNMLSDAIRLGKITAIDNSSGLQNVTVDVRVGVIDTKVARVQNYGFSSSPAAGDALMGVEVTVNGNRFVVAIDDMGSRPKGGEAGDVWMYHREGHMIHMTKDKIINVTAETLNADVTTTNWNGDIFHTGNLTRKGDETVTGDRTHSGDTSQTGDTTQDGKIIVSDDVIAANVSLKNHPQYAPDNTTPMTGKPIPTP